MVFFFIQGPSNPDVFASPHGIKYPKYNEDQRAKFQNFRDNIVRVLNKVSLDYSILSLFFKALVRVGRKNILPLMTYARKKTDLINA